MQRGGGTSDIILAKGMFLKAFIYTFQPITNYMQVIVTKKTHLIKFYIDLIVYNNHC